MPKIINAKPYQQARLSRDARFDGRFFVAVKTTSIYCRPICPARIPNEDNIEYFEYAHDCTQAGYRPCLRCRPDSAPDSPVWNGVDTTLTRAKRLIDTGALEHGNLVDLSLRLGISDRYLRQLFKKTLGISPKSYALFRQCEFAKNLLHQTQLPITEIAFASGFKSIRRFNDCFKKQLLMTPSDVRRSEIAHSNSIELKLYYRPPYCWKQMQGFLSVRLIEGLEWSDESCYGRTFKWHSQQDQAKGTFTAKHNAPHHRFDVTIEIDNLRLLKPVINNIRRLLDLDIDNDVVENCLNASGFHSSLSGLRLPGTWDVFEAGIRAILSQQVSVAAAHKLVTAVVHELGEPLANNKRFYFPQPKDFSTHAFDFLKMPLKRKQTLNNLGQHYLESANPDDIDNWLALKGIGPWTIDYAKMRGLSDPDIYLAGDLGVKKAMANLDASFTPAQAAPFRSYLTFQLWNQLS